MSITHVNLKSHNTAETAQRSSRSSEIRNFAMQHDKVVMYLLAMLKDCVNLAPSYRYVDFLRDSETIKQRYAHEGLSFATSTLPSFFDSVLSYLETGVSVYPSFKLCSGRKYPVFLQGLLQPIYESPCDADTVIYMQCLFQLCVAFKKLKGPYRKEVLLKQLKQFKLVDEGLPDFQKPDAFVVNILKTATSLITEVLSGLDITNPNNGNEFIPRPGPGATNTPTEKHERFQPHVLYLTLNEIFPYREWFYPPSLSQQYSRWDLKVGKSYRTSLDKLERRDSPTSRFKFVHKTFGKPRGICIEELEMQFFQQALRRAMYKCIETHPLTKGYVSFTKQCINGELALQASRDRKYATIDMSSASDRIPLALVEILFSGNVSLLRALKACSTRVIQLPDGDTIVAKKFAPMGSAVCFPVMGLVHWALIQSLALFFSAPWVESHPVYVYGDDIIVSRDVAWKVYSFLPLFGMKLNKEKSFMNSFFRESCGMNAYLGVDITPTRFKTIVKNPPNNEELISALKNESALEAKGFRETALLVRQEIQDCFTHVNFLKFPCVNGKTPVLGWIRDVGDAPSQLDCRRRWNPETQQLEYSLLVLAEKPNQESLPSADASYLRHLIMETSGQSDKVGGQSTGLQIRRQWVPGSVITSSDVPTWVSVDPYSPLQDFKGLLKFIINNLDPWCGAGRPTSLSNQEAL